jgi:hypothetical protein
MTLHGEQDEEEVDVDLHRENRAVWNAWSCQQLDDDAAAELAKQARVIVAETRGWAQIASEVKSKHRAEMKTRNDDDFTYPGFPDFESSIRCSQIQFVKILVLKNRIFTQPVDFTSATFTKTANFSSATFTQTADFSSATFTQYANFNSATFTRDAFFLSTIFTQNADFYSATFDGPAKFVAARFGVRDATEICVPFLPTPRLHVW